MHGDVHCVVVVNNVQVLCFSDWSSLTCEAEGQHLRHLWVHDTLRLNTSQCRCHCCECVKRAAEKQELDLSQLTVCEVLRDDDLHTYSHSQSARLLTDDCLLWMQFCEWLQHDTQRVSSFCTKFCGQMEHYWHVRCVLGHHNSHVWTWNKLHAMWQHEYGVHSTQNVWVVLSAISVVSLLTSQQEFSGDCPTMAAWRCALAVSWRFWFCNSGAPALHGEDVICRKFDCTWRVHCMASLVVGSNSARFFSCEDI